MIEQMLQAERALLHGMIDQAERIYRQAIEADPHNSIAVVGLARVALERADDRGALELARRALEIDPENLAARRLAERMAEVLRHRGEAVAPGPEAGVPELEAGVPEPASRGPQPSGSPARRVLDRLRRRG